MEKCQINTSTPGGHTNASLHGILQWKISTKVDPVGVEDCHKVCIRTRAVGVFCCICVSGPEFSVFAMTLANSS